jgi:hypothetical protein
LAEFESLLNEIELEPFEEVEEHTYALWKTPVWFILIVGLMLGEWAVRKWVNLV